MRTFVISGLTILLLSVAAFATDFTKGIIFDIPQGEMEKQFGKIPPSILTPSDSAEIMSFQFDADTLKVLAILVDWIDRPGIYPRETFDSLLFSRNIWPGGSMADFYFENSYGKMTVVGEVIDWVNSGLYTSNFDFESVLPVINPTVDFSLFDANNDGDVDAVIFIRSGTGEEDSKKPSDIWSHAYTYWTNGGPGPFDGKYVSRWNTAPELFPMRNPLIPTSFSGADTLNSIRVFAHELGHNLGLPDLYDYDDKLYEPSYYTPNDWNDHPMYDWGVMGYYGYGIFSIGSEIPSHFCGWSKKDLGWITPTELTGTHTDLVITNVETTDQNSLFMLPINPIEDEYFLLEYRNSESTALFDKVNSDFSCYYWPDLAFGGEALNRGLLITHIHENVGGYGNNGTPSYANYHVMVEDAGYNPASDVYSNLPDFRPSDSAQFWYPFETRIGAPFTSEVAGKEEFSPTSVPNSDSYFGPSGIVVRVDSIVDDKLYAFVHNPNTDVDGDGWGAMFDNCPDTYNPDQADSNSNDLGDVCDFCCKDERGNANYDAGDKSNVADVSYLVAYLFGIPTGPTPYCMDEANANGDIEDKVNVADVSYLVAWLFGIPSGPAPPPCP